jgi:hypothetical protein
MPTQPISRKQYTTEKPFPSARRPVSKPFSPTPSASIALTAGLPLENKSQNYRYMTGEK